MGELARPPAEPRVEVAAVGSRAYAGVVHRDPVAAAAAQHRDDGLARILPCQFPQRYTDCREGPHLGPMAPQKLARANMLAQ